MSLEGNVEGTNEIKGRIYTLPQADETLTKEGFAADAKATGDKFKELEERFDNIDPHDAENVGYDNSKSGLESENMQSAIDELAENSFSAKNGGMVNGPIHTKNADNGYASFHKNNTATTDYGVKVVDRSKDNKNAYMTICAAKGEFSYTNPDGETFDILTEECKPFKEYTGNGSATSRTVSTGGTGRLALLYCSTHCSLVTPKGAWVTTLSTGAITWIDGAKLSFINGDLLTGTANEACNKENETYYIQVV